MGQMICPHSSEMYPFNPFGAKEMLLTTNYDRENFTIQSIRTKNSRMSINVYLKEYR